MKRFFETNKAIVIILFALAFFTTMQAQDTTDIDLQQKMENIVEQSNNEETDFTQFVEVIEYYKKHPINLNNTSADELNELNLLTDVQINNLLSHISKNGKLINIYELQSIDGFDLNTISRILPYVFVTNNISSPSFSIKEMLKRGNHTFITRFTQILEEQKGFLPISDSALNASPNSRYLGSKSKIYTRYRFTYGTNVSWGITGEKDAGEEFFKGSQKNGFDFYSAHFYLKNIKYIKALAIGDYTIGFGQGLTAWNGLAYGKTADAINIKRTTSGIRPYSSVDENAFFRGAATTIGFKKIELTGFFSSKKIDANVTSFDSLNNEVAVISSLQETGYHTTPSEIADKHAINQTVYGGSLSYKSRKAKIAINSVNTLLNADYIRKLYLYNQFEFSKRRLDNLSIDYSLLVKNINIFGETAVSDNGGIATINGLIASLDPRLSLSLCQRYYQRNYQSIFSNAFAESTRPANESGIYMSMVAKPTNEITINAYYDSFKFPWLKYQVDAPSTGNEFLVQVNYTPSKKLDMYFRYRERNKFQNNNVSDGINYIVPTHQKNIRYHISYTASKSIKLKNRIEYMEWKKGDNKTEKGFVIYQDLSYKKLGSPVTFTLRYALFETDSYDSRIYAYENDIPGAFSIPSYYYRGSRTYVLINYDITRKIEIWLRWSQIYYSNKNVISEGSLTEIQGNTRSEIKAQVRIKF